MYCSNCGGEATIGLRFCKRCGANLYNTPDAGGGITTPRNVTGAVWALALATIAVGLGGLGIVFGIVACYTTKFTENTPILEPLLILIYSYLSYITSEIFGVSSIIA